MNPSKVLHCNIKDKTVGLLILFGNHQERFEYNIYGNIPNF